MITQIYSLVDPEEAVEVVKAGADHIGILVGNENCPCCIDEATALEIYRAVGDSAVKVLIDASDDVETTIDRCSRLNPDVIHFCMKPAGAVEDMKIFRTARPDIKIMMAIAVSGMECVELAKSYEPYCDFLLLDTYNPGLDAIGAAGVTHDWRVDRAIVEAVKLPVILAGGLGPDNVADAIRAVRPAGVDSLTKTSVKENGVLVRKDIALVREFCRRAKEAAEE